MDPKQRLIDEDRQGWYIATLVIGIVVGLLIIDGGTTIHNTALTALGSIIASTPATVGFLLIPRKPLLSWHKKYIVVLIVVCFLLAYLLIMLWFRTENIVILGLSMVMLTVPGLLAVVMARRKKARDKKQHATSAS